MDPITHERLTQLHAEYTAARDAAVAAVHELAAQYEAARDAAIARANANQGALEAVQQLLALFTEPPPTEGP